MQLSVFRILLSCSLSEYDSFLSDLCFFLNMFCTYIILGTGATPQASAAANGVSMSYLGPGGLGDSLTSDERYKCLLPSVAPVCLRLCVCVCMFARACTTQFYYFLAVCLLFVFVCVRIKLGV